VTHVLLALAALAYCAAGMGYLWYLIGTDPIATRLSAMALCAGLVLHGATLAIQASRYGFSPAMDLQDGLSLLAWFLGLAFLLLNTRWKVPVLGAFVVPLMLVVTLPALGHPDPGHPLPPSLRDAHLWVHVVVAFLGYAAFALASLIGVAYLLQERGLKLRHEGASPWVRLPSLELMDRLNERVTLAGFALLTVTILSGAAFARGIWGQTLSLLEPSELMAIATWLVYGVLLWGRLQAGWRGRRAAVLTLVGFAVAMLSFIGLSFCPAGRHGGSFE
jgi:cytochrome c-type biogenesis protein CcsB